MAKRIKLTRKKIKQDEFISFFDRSVLYVHERKKEFLYAVMGVVVVGVAVYGIASYFTQQGMTASYLLQDAFQTRDNVVKEKKKNNKYYESQDNEPAFIKALDTVRTRYPRTASSKLAEWIEIEGLIKDWKYKDALPRLEKFARAGGDYTLMARFKLAQLYAAMGRFDDAAATSDKLLQDEEQTLFPKALLLMEKARIHALHYRISKDEKEKQTAVSAYTQIINQYPNSSVHASASDALDKLRGLSTEEPISSKSDTDAASSL